MGLILKVINFAVWYINVLLIKQSTDIITKLFHYNN